MSLSSESLLKEIKAELSDAPAAEVAEAFLSPHISKEFFLLALEEEGPSLWIVNRSDVWTETLQILSQHRIEGIAKRALEKISQRSSKLLTISPPQIPVNYTEITDDSVEDFLGHPLVPLEAILFFTRSIKEDHRATSALSATRRALEYPPNWFEEKVSRQQFQSAMETLLQDPSSYVRSYAARFPLLESAMIIRALAAESNPRVRARLLQHQESPAPEVERVLLEKNSVNQDPFLQVVAALDQRIANNTRREVLKNREVNALTRRIHEWHLLREIKS